MYRVLNYKLGNEQNSYDICEEIINNLERIDFRWVVSDSIFKKKLWNEMFEVLKIFKAKHGHAYVPILYSDNPKLRKWVHTQCKGYTNYNYDKK